MLRLRDCLEGAVPFCWRPQLRVAACAIPVPGGTPGCAALDPELDWSLWPRWTLLSLLLSLEPSVCGLASRTRPDSAATPGGAQVGRDGGTAQPCPALPQPREQGEHGHGGRGGQGAQHTAWAAGDVTRLSPCCHRGTSARPGGFLGSAQPPRDCVCTGLHLKCQLVAPHSRCWTLTSCENCPQLCGHGRTRYRSLISIYTYR